MTTDATAMPTRAQIDQLIKDWKRGCICREFIGGALKLEADCPVHTQDDAARLAWLEQMAREPGGLLLHADMGPTGRLGLGLAQPYRTLRQAIDEAMRLRGQFSPP